MVYVKTISSPLGDILLSSNGDYLTGLWFEGQTYFAATISMEDTTQNSSLHIFQQVEEWLRIYFSGKEPPFTPALSPKGSDFRQLVWKVLLSIPYGETLSYSDISNQLFTYAKHKTSPRAVGGAVGHNPISLIIPCHRVIGKNGDLTGFAGGLERKVHLLKLENIEGFTSVVA